MELFTPKTCTRIEMTTLLAIFLNPFFLFSVAFEPTLENLVKMDCQLFAFKNMAHSTHCSHHEKNPLLYHCISRKIKRRNPQLSQNSIIVVTKWQKKLTFPEIYDDSFLV